MPLICFASPKGGVGKTTIAANIVGSIARSGSRAIALDLDPQNALRLHFGIPLSDGGGFIVRLGERADWRGSLCATRSGVGLLPYGATDMPGAIGITALVAQSPPLLTGPVQQMLADPATWVVVDTSPGPSAMLAALLPAVDLLVTVLLVDAMSVSLIPAIESGAAYGVAGDKQPAHGFVLNQLDPRTRLGTPLLNAATRHLGDRLLGVVYRDEHVAEAVAAQKLITDYAPASRAAQDMAGLARTIAERVVSLRQAMQRGPR